MELQTNPYLIWQLLPGIALLGVGLYIQSRPVKKRESNVFSLLMFGGSLWAIANAIQFVSPNLQWQRFWNLFVYLGIMLVPTSWFFMSVKLTGFFRSPIEKFEKWLWLPPALLYLGFLTNGFHKLFFTSYRAVSSGGYVALQNNYGLLFYAHTVYSYGLIVAGIVMVTISLITRFKQYGVQAYGLIIGVLAPLIGNAYFLFGSPPPGFPDPTPIIFSVTGITFAWAIFGGHILEVVPLAHETIVRKLSAGVIVLDAQKNLRDINPAALEMLGWPAKDYLGIPLTELIDGNSVLAAALERLLSEASEHDQSGTRVAFSAAQRTLDVLASPVPDNFGETTGWLIQFRDVSEIKQAEENVAATQTTMKAILNTLQDNFFEADPNGVITYANRAFIETLGFTRWEEVQGKNFRHFTDRNNVREIFQKFKLLYETKKPLDPFQYNYRTKDGNVLIGETTVSPIMEGDRVIGSRGVIRDITARVNAEREILRQKELLDSLMQQSPIAMVINDMEKRITVVNPAFEKMFGYTRDEVMGRSLDELLSPGDKTDGDNELSTIIMRNKMMLSSRRKRKDGSLVDVEIFTAPFFVSGERFGYLAFYNDISERLKAEADLQRTQKSYLAVLDTLQDSYFEVLRSGVFVYVNKALCEWTGYSREELIGRHFRIVSSRKSVRETALKHEAMFESGIPILPFEFTYRRKDGREFASEMVVSPNIENGVVVGARGIIRDISVRVQAEEILRQAKEAAESRAGELAAINRVALKVGQSLDLKDILQSVCRELTSIFEIRNAGIGLLTPDKSSLKIIAFHSDDPRETSALGMVLPVEGNASTMEVISKKRTVFIQDAQSDPRTSSIADLSRSRGTRSIMIVPLLARGAAIGTIGMPAKDPTHTFTKDEIELAETIASQIAAAVDNAQLHARTESALDVAERDLEIGRQIQSGFFPEKLPNVPGWEIAAHFHAARQVAGDFYDIFPLKNSNLLAFIIADVCDKGVGAALFMVLFRSLLRAFSEIKVSQGDVREKLLNIINSTNNFIAEYHGKSNMFATLFFGVLDPESGTLYYVNGGHEPPVVLNKRGVIIQRLMPTGPAVGMFKDLAFRVETVHFAEGDFLVGFTDGTTDARNSSGEQFSEARLLKSIAAPWTSIFSMLFELNVELKKHIGAQSQFDDVTVIAFRRQSDSDHGHHAICRKADLIFLDELREFVESAAIHSGLNKEETFAFKLAADEICANIIQYGYEGLEPGLLSISLDREGTVERLIIRDNGKYFSPDQAQTPDLEADWSERQIGGLGIALVKNLMDNITYNRTNDGVNELVLEKKIDQNETNRGDEYGDQR